MREIKFRAKIMFDNTWCYGFLIIRKCDGIEHYYIYNPYWDETEIDEYAGDEGKISIKDCFVLVEPKSVGQFAGLFDRTGREIYEGDVLKLNIYNNVGKHSIRIVTFDRGCFGFIDTTGKFYPLGLIIGNKGDEKIFEVIGNIYDNKLKIKGD